MQWFEVDKQGLSKILDRKGRAFILNELVSNALDERTTEIQVELSRIPGTKQVKLVVRDDSPLGFADLTHTFRIFADSKKKGEAEKRGRFNLGEKLCLALCNEARITSTTGTVIFDGSGRSRSPAKTERGSVFSATLKMTNEEMAECESAARQLLIPASVTLTFNGERMPSRAPIENIEATLPTEVADEEGFLRRTTRRTTIELYEPLADVDGVAKIFEMGVPVCETGDRYHVNVMQKVPLSLERDSVSPAYLAKIRALVLERMATSLDTEQANSPWVKNAIEKHGADLPAPIVEAVVTQRFGDKRVIYDPSDPEANSLAASRGYTVVHGSQLSKSEWEAVRAAGAMLPAGRVTPSPRPYSADGSEQREVPPEQWTPGMWRIARYAKEIASRLLDVDLQVRIVNDITWWPAATYGKGCPLTMNLGSLGHRWFNEPNLDRVNDLLLHEFGHEVESNHLSANYYKALTRFGAGLVGIALKNPEVFNLDRYGSEAAK